MITQKLLLVEIKDVNGDVVDTVLCKPIIFKTGRRGFSGLSKMLFENERYQNLITIVKIGPPDAE